MYGGANRKDWRSVSVDDVKLDAAELRSQLLPTIKTALRAPEERPIEYDDEALRHFEHDV